MDEEVVLSVKRDQKSRMFTMLFSDKKRLLELYNAVSGRNYKDSAELIVNTLENAIYMAMKNDLSFIIDSRLSLYEHQSTYNPNMPLRFLFYLSDLYSELTKKMNLYGTKKIAVPTPKFVVFYNGREERPDHEVMKLSDSYTVKENEYALELIAEVININKGHNAKLMQACKNLQEYVEYTYLVRKYAQELSIEAAVDKAIMECIQRGVLKEFLLRNRMEARAMNIYEYNEEEHMRMEREEAFEDGYAAGEKSGYAAGERNRDNLWITLMNHLTADGRADDIPRLASEPEFLKEMQEKYEIVCQEKA